MTHFNDAVSKANSTRAQPNAKSVGALRRQIATGRETVARVYAGVSGQKAVSKKLVERGVFATCCLVWMCHSARMIDALR
jgi:hypothetical protein